MVKFVGVESGMDIRRGYSQLQHRVPYAMSFLDSSSVVEDMGVSWKVEECVNYSCYIVSLRKTVTLPNK
jgi:hypothetical protein